jgi:membrane-associated phospholipid phosphatase
MSRGLGWFDAFRDLVPEWGVVVLGVVTQLGDVWFLSLLVGSVYWAGTKRGDGAAAIAGLTLSGYSLIVALKHVFALPRPDRVLVRVGALPEPVHPLYDATATATGYGFPSGHALVATVVYLSLAEHLSVGTRRARYLGAAAIVTIVSFSRVGLGVHYLVDVVAGIAVGIAFLLVARALLNRWPTHRGTVGFAIAVAVAGIAVVVTDAGTDAVLLAGASLGAFAGWQLAVLARTLDAGRGPIRTSRPLTVRSVLASVALASLVAGAVAFWPDPLRAGSGPVGLVAAALVATPVVARCDGIRTLGRRAIARSQ